jgi:hypothetical protein
MAEFCDTSTVPYRKILSREGVKSDEIRLYAVSIR